MSVHIPYEVLILKNRTDRSTAVANQAREYWREYDPRWRTNTKPVRQHQPQIHHSTYHIAQFGVIRIIFYRDLRWKKTTDDLINWLGQITMWYPVAAQNTYELCYSYLVDLQKVILISCIRNREWPTVHICCNKKSKFVGAKRQFFCTGVTFC